MGNKNIHIEKLRIRLPKSASASAGQIAKGLGDEIINQIAQKVAAQRGVRHVGEVDAGRIKKSGNADLTRQIARRIADAVGEKTK